MQYQNLLKQYLIQISSNVCIFFLPYKKILSKVQDFNFDLTSCFNLAEQEQSVRYYLPADQERYVVGRSAVRHLLAERLTCSPQSLAFTKGHYGKPYVLEKENAYSNWQFNISHSGDYILLGLIRQSTKHSPQIGVDIEKSRKKVDYLSISKLLFDQEDQEKLNITASLEDKEVPQQDFFRLWVRYEALSKLEGTGLLARKKHIKAYSIQQKQFKDSDSALYHWAVCWRN